MCIRDSATALSPLIDKVKVNEVMPLPLILTDPLPELAPVATIGVAPLNILSPVTWNPVALLPDSLVKLCLLYTSRCV